MGRYFRYLVFFLADERVVPFDDKVVFKPDRDFVAPTDSMSGEDPWATLEPGILNRDVATIMEADDICSGSRFYRSTRRGCSTRWRKCDRVAILLHLNVPSAALHRESLPFLKLQETRLQIQQMLSYLLDYRQV